MRTHSPCRTAQSVSTPCSWMGVSIQDRRPERYPRPGESTPFVRASGTARARLGPSHRALHGGSRPRPRSRSVRGSAGRCRVSHRRNSQTAWGCPRRGRDAGCPTRTSGVYLGRIRAARAGPRPMGAGRPCPASAPRGATGALDAWRDNPADRHAGRRAHASLPPVRWWRCFPQISNPTSSRRRRMAFAIRSLLRRRCAPPARGRCPSAWSWRSAGTPWPPSFARGCSRVRKTRAPAGERLARVRRTRALQGVRTP